MKRIFQHPAGWLGIWLFMSTGWLVSQGIVDALTPEQALIDRGSVASVSPFLE